MQSRLSLAVLAVVLCAFIFASGTEAACSNTPYTSGSSPTDGFLPIFGPNKMLYQVRVGKAASILIDCTDPTTQQDCPASPYTITVPSYTLSTPVYSYGAQFECLDPTDSDCNRLLIPVRADAGAVATFGLVCFDINTKALCSSNDYVSYTTENSPTANFPVMSPNLPRYGDRIYNVDYNMKLNCFDVSTHTVCPDVSMSSPSLPVITGGTYSIISQMDVSLSRPLVYFVVSYGGSTNVAGFSDVRLYCWDILQTAACTGFTSGAVVLSSASPGAALRDFFFYRGASSPYNPTGVCIRTGGTTSCLTTTGTAMTSSINFGPLGNDIFTHEQASSKMFFTEFANSIVYCVDFATSAACSPTTISPSSGTKTYGPVLDPRGECLFSITTAGYIWNFDEAGNAPCQNGPVVTAGNDNYVEPIPGIYTIPILNNDNNADPSQLTAASFTGPDVGLITAIDNVAGTVTIDATGQRAVIIPYTACSAGYSVNPASAPNAIIRLVICNDTLDFDSDGVNNCDDFDIDNDGILNYFEGDTDTDGDGFKNWQDSDSDNDGIPDLIEALQSSGSGYIVTTAFLLDFDGDGILDGPVDGFGVAMSVADPTFFIISDLSRPDTDGDGIHDFLDLDSDNDGLFDLAEGATPGTNLPSIDVDNDGVLDFTLAFPYIVRDADNDGNPDFRDLDSDNDGLWDMIEATITGSSVVSFDTDSDGMIDPAYINARGSFSITSQQALITYPDTDNDSNEDYRDLDSDDDAIYDVVEGSRVGIDLYTVDSDSDGIFDGVDRSDMIAPDQDLDTVPDYRDLDSDNDGLCDIIEGAIDVYNWYYYDGDASCVVDFVMSPSDYLLFNPPPNSDNDLVHNFRDLDSDNDGASDTQEAAFDLPFTDTFVGPDSDGDGIADIVDQSQLNYGGPVGLYYIPDTDGDGAADFADTDSDEDGIPDYSQKSGRSDAEGMAAEATPVDVDLDGIEDTYYDEYDGFGGLYYRTFDIVKPTRRSVWKMYLASPIQWAHNLTSDFDSVEISLKSFKNGDPVIFSRLDIGPPDHAINEVFYTPSKLLPDCIRVVVKFFSTGGSLAATIVRESEYFALSTGTHNIYCQPPP
eukprot:CAMPEP_0184343516 /NCGR_PEP_ID=MMETSP1089-20130417/12022_1 /TAXON_ID=38269 ORGANISM="Gloeochaete wittrockiana, Strain SAG46.84" /NCGR_SAMPLE_ID=MMETSP1089 /ASSEMBLY_ACC=CAM_ASM_000445 /LENGTH=1093 /DNA_ID=CAMNT_0026672843 /DNA_START=93 /DNA_END=3374 /DNA_ORIENTATION=+